MYVYMYGLSRDGAKKTFNDKDTHPIEGSQKHTFAVLGKYAFCAHHGGDPRMTTEGSKV